MPLHPQTRALLDLAAAQGLPPIASQTPQEARAQMRAATHLMGTPTLVPPEQTAVAEDRAIPGPAGPIPVRIYAPPPREAPRPALVYFHGGGWVIGDLETHDQLCWTLARASGAIVVAVDYRLAPEHRFPAAAEDAFAATAWVVAHAPEIGADPDRISVGGDSAGGNLAAVVALLARDRRAFRLACQVLIYPITDHDFDTPSYRDFATGFGLSRDDMIWFWDHYLPDPAARGSPYASPLRAPDLTGLPPALVLTAEFDVLRDEGEAYAARLEAADVPVTLTRYGGTTHGFIRRLDALDSAIDALSQVAGALVRVAHNPVGKAGHYLLRDSDDFSIGATEDGGQVLLGPLDSALVGFAFDAEGRFLKHEVKELPDFETDDQLDRALEWEEAQWLASLGFRPGPIAVRRFFLDGPGFGIADLTEYLEEFLADPSGSCRELATGSEIPADQLERISHGLIRSWWLGAGFAFRFGEEYRFSIDGPEGSD